MSWEDLDMEIEQQMREMDERLELEGRAMTAMEEHRHYNDGLLRKMDAMTVVQLNIGREISEDLKKGFAEIQSEGRAHREALWRLLDRLPPPQTEGK